MDLIMGPNKMEKVKLSKWRKCFNQDKKLTTKEEELLKSLMMIRNKDLGENQQNLMEEIRTNEKLRLELIRRTVSTRDNDFILKILQVMKNIFPPDEPDVNLSVAGMGLNYQEPEEESFEMEEVVKEKKKKTSHVIHMLAANIVSTVDSTKDDLVIGILPQVAMHAIFLATIKDDPESLEAILTWTKETGIRVEELDEAFSCDTKSINPLLVATLESYKQCANILLEYGFTISIHYEDKESIDEMTENDDSFGGSIFQYYWHNLQKEDANEKKRKDMEVNEVVNQVRRRRIKVKKFSAKIFKELDPLERLLRFRAFASPMYISLAYTDFMKKNGGKCNTICNLKNECLSGCNLKFCKECKRPAYEKELLHLDPLRKSFACATYANTLSDYYTEYSCQYAKIAKVCLGHAEDLLEQCENMEEVKTLLQDKKSANLEQERNWEIAIWKKHKHFVSHHYYQQFIHEKLNGEDFALGMYNWIGQVLFVPLAMCLFICYPFVVIADLFRKADILFVPPNDKIKENAFFSFFRTQIHRAVYRKIVHFFIELIFLIFVILTLLDPYDVEDEIELAYYDIITPVLFVLFFVDNILDVIRNKWKFLLSFWNTFTLINNLLFVVGYSLRGYGFWRLKAEMASDDRALLSGNHPANIGSTLYGIAATLAILRTTRWLLLNRTLGPIVTSVIKMIKDIFLFLILFMIVFVGFAFGIYFIYHIYHGNESRLEEQSLTSASTALPSLFWAILDPGNSEFSQILKNVTMKNENGTLTCKLTEEGNCVKKISYEFSHFMGIALWAVYQLVVTIMLINMLIAMMNTTYTETSESAEVQWKYSRSFFHLNYLNFRSSLPPPFRLLIYYPAKFIHEFWGRVDKNSLRNEDINSVKDKEEYYELLVELVNRKRIHDSEDSGVDDFADLRQDIRNMIDNSRMNVERQERWDSQNISQSIEMLCEKVENLENEIKNLRGHSSIV